jgi:cysteine desulfurase/selenocysteine lyase
MYTRRTLGGLLAGVFGLESLSRLAKGGAMSSVRNGPDQWSRHFPALGTKAADPFVYLDSAATTQRPIAVLDALVDFYTHGNANPGRTQHRSARVAYERYEDARRAVAAFIHAKRPEEIVWVRGTSEAINLVAASWGEAELKAGDEILLTVAEHASCLLPWQMAAHRAGASIRIVDTDNAGRISLEDLQQKLSARTRLLAFTHVSNVLGYINPAKEICARAHRVGARVLIDGAQSAPHVPIDVQDLDCDFFAFSSHKMLGPMGIGVLWARHELLETMPPYQAGSNMAHAVDLDSAQLEHGALKFGAGTPNVAGPIGLAAAIRFINELGRDQIRAHESAITDYGLAALQKIPRVRLLGPSESTNRLPVFSFEVDGMSASAVQRSLDARGVGVRAGDLAALPLLKRLGTTTATRASCYLYTSKRDIDALTAGLFEIAKS